MTHRPRTAVGFLFPPYNHWNWCSHDRHEIRGTSVENAVAIDRVASIVRSRAKRQPVVVVSAMAKVTDGLLGIARDAAAGNVVAALEQCIALHERHRHAICELIPDGS